MTFSPTWLSSPIRRFMGLSVCALAAALPSSPRAQTPAAPAASLSARPLEDFFKRAKYSNLQLSPDGTLLAAVVPLNERRNLALIDLQKRSIVALTTLKEQDVYRYNWVGDRTLQVQTANLNSAGRLLELKQNVLVDTSGRVVRDMQGVSARSRFLPTRIIGRLDRAGDDLIVVNNDRNVYGLDAWRYNPRTNDKTLLTSQSPGDVTQFVADRAGQVRVAVSVPRGRNRVVLSYRRNNDSAWTTLRDDPYEEQSIHPIAFDFDNKTLFVLVRNQANGGRNDVYAFDPETNTMGARIFEAKDIDATTVVFDFVAKKAVGVTDASGTAVRWIDPEWQRLQQSIDQALPGAQNHVSWGRFDTGQLIVHNETETQPPVFYLFERGKGKLEEVVAAYPWLKESELSPRSFVRYKARDGLSIPAYLTLPKRPAGAKPPLIVNIHGGPYVVAEGFGYDGEAQFFASRGYAVLEPHFRGTRGYGDAFYKAGWKQWGLAMQDDVTDGVRWLIESGKVDPDRVCLFGGSYGGYATLWGLEKEPQMFRCGVAFVAVSDLEMMFDVSWSDFMQAERGGDSTGIFTRWIGDPDKDREKMRAVSPLYHADRIKAPLLLAYGASDARVPLVHGNRMKSALDRNGKRYEWVVYDDEGHGFSKDENRYDFYRRIDAFLAKSFAADTTQAAMAATPAQ